MVLFAGDTTIYSHGDIPFEAVHKGTFEFEEAKDWFD